MRFEVRNDPNRPDFEITRFRCPSPRAALVGVTLMLCTAFLIGAGIHGWLEDDFAGLAAVADYVQWPMAALFGYFFGVRSEQADKAGSDGDAGGGL
jgi:hypothetical protein